MKILDAAFVTSVAGPGQAGGETAPQLLIMGRSNVGKSSLINSLLLRKIARTSSTPGATRTINIYAVRYELQGERKRFILADFPGFGYSRVSKGTYKAWEGMVDGYLHEGRSVSGVLWVYDVRRDFDDLDVMVYDWLKEQEFPFTFVLTKVDKDGRNAAYAKKKEVEGLLPGVPVFLYSSKDGFGRPALLDHLAATIGPRP
jgi:GTP-binding protein